ncbi:MFS transporter [Clavibacter sp. VKM Ac-2872]|uniref:MFS transporter n=1 Tax=Clavibacter sp. VKM Ac-2872 TaxID=2783812 RepID=UPI00188C7939|nr:MFS transporter [Clavibacter sp. VKM Ac-2872]
MSAVFRSLRAPNYRIWFAGALVSNVGTWMQRTAQDWIVLTELTRYDATAVGIVMALQFGPMLLLSPYAGLIADRYDKRRVLIITQGTMAVLGLGLGLVVLSGRAELWHVYLFALLLGIASALDAPARQSFVSELVSDDDLSNAVALNSASFSAARMIGPAVAGVLIAGVGTGWVFLINAVSFIAVLIALTRLRVGELRRPERVARSRGQLREGFRYIGGRPDIMVILVIVFLVGAFGYNFPIFTSTMASVEFGKGATEFGLLSSSLAVGSVAGALLSARRERPRIRLVFVGAALFGIATGLAAIAPTYLLFALALVLVGVVSQTLMTSANSTVQLTVEPRMRGRVMAVYMAIFVGGTPLGAPIVGWVANTWGPRAALMVGAASGIVAALIAIAWLVLHRHLRVSYRIHRTPHLLVTHDGDGRDRREDAREDIEADEAVARRT